MRVTSMPTRNLQEKVSVLLHEKFEHVKHDLENSTELFLDPNWLEGLRTSYLMTIDGPAFSWVGGWPSSTLASRALETITQRPQRVILCRLPLG